MVNLDKISRNGKALFLAYDQGLEHGPTDFNDESVDPENVIKIANSGFFTGFICQKGIAEKYPINIPLILKLNGKTSLANDEPMAEQICSVDEAISLGAIAVGYTIYLGSEFEEKMMKEFAEIEKEAHAKNLPLISWIYPRGKSVKNPDSVEIIAYAARVGLEIGADIVKVRIPNVVVESVSSVGVDLRVDPHADRPGGLSLLQNLQWVVKSAGRCRVVFAGGTKMSESEFLETAKMIRESGAFGMAVGRNIWQSENPISLSQKLSGIILR